MSDHWYSRAGEPAYEQITKGGGLRPTNLRDARQLGLVPSVTTVLSVVAKPQLEKWKRDQSVLAALTLPRLGGESEPEFLRRIDADSQAQAKAAAEEGTRIHDAIEQYFKEGYPSTGHYIAHVRAVRARLSELFPDVSDWVAEASFADPRGYGGKVDLHSPSTGIVVDFKGKDGDFSDGKKLAYDQHWQLAAYQQGLGLSDNVCANLFVSRTHPGAVAHHIWSVTDMCDGWRVFRSALALWKVLKKFDPGFNQAKAA